MFITGPAGSISLCVLLWLNILQDHLRLAHAVGSQSYRAIACRLQLYEAERWLYTVHCAHTVRLYGSQPAGLSKGMQCRADSPCNRTWVSTLQGTCAGVHWLHRVSGTQRQVAQPG